MSVALVTSRGVVVVDLFLSSAPMNSFNFIKMCKLGWFDNALFIEVVENRMIKVGQLECPCGQTIYSLISGDQSPFIQDEVNVRLTHSVAGMLSTCNTGPNMNNSNFFITLGGDLSRHDSLRTIFGEVSEGFELIKAISGEPVDAAGRPLRNIRIRNTRVLYDPFEDPPGFAGLSGRFQRFRALEEGDRLEDGEEVPDVDLMVEREVAEKRRAEQNRKILEMLGDVASSDAAPPESTLFVCNLASITESEGLKVFFSRFGDVESVDLIRNPKTGEPRGYAFVRFAKRSQAENAFMKTQRAVVDGKLIKVDFCQSLKRATKRHGNGPDRQD